MSELIRYRFLVHPAAPETRRLTTPPASIEKFERYVRLALEFAEEVTEPAFAEWAQTVNDANLRAALQERYDAIIAMVARMTCDLERQGQLRVGWTGHATAEWVTSHLFPTTYYAFRVILRWPADLILERTINMFRRDVIVAEKSTRRRPSTKAMRNVLPSALMGRLSEVQ